MYDITRNGETLTTVGSYDSAWRWLGRNHQDAVEAALLQAGFSIEPAPVQPGTALPYRIESRDSAKPVVVIDGLPKGTTDSDVIATLRTACAEIGRSCGFPDVSVNSAKRRNLQADGTVRISVVNLAVPAHA